MDQELQRLAREAQARPADEGVARRYDQALRRAGRDDEVRARFRFKLRCPLRYEELTPTDDPLARACDRCGRQVRFVDAAPALTELVAQGQCVALPRAGVEGAIIDLSNDPRLHSAAAPGSPCVVEAELPWVALDRLDERLLRLVPGALAHDHRAVPVARRGKAVVVAFAEPPDERTREHLTIVVGGALEVVRAEAREVERVLAERYPEERFVVGELAGEV